MNGSMREFRKMAADKIREDGWIQGALFRHGEGYSLRGAINAVTASNPHLWTRTTMRILDELRNEIPFSFHADIDRWNDAPERTKEEVIALLEGTL